MAKQSGNNTKIESGISISSPHETEQYQKDKRIHLYFILNCFDIVFLI